MPRYIESLPIHPGNPIPDVKGIAGELVLLPPSSSRRGRQRPGNSQDFPQVDGLLAEALYMRDVGRYALLSAEEEVMLARTRIIGEAAGQQMKALPPDDPKRVDFEPLARAGELARQRLIECNLRLVISRAKRYQGRGLPFLDLIQEGNIGLDRAVTLYDPETGYRFSTYAYWWIRRSITRAIYANGRTIRVPQHVIECLTKINNISGQFEQAHGRLPNPQELADTMGIPVDLVTDAMECSKPIDSLDQPIEAGNEGSTLMDLVEAPNKPPEEEAEKRVTREYIAGVLPELLSKRELIVLLMKYGMGKWEENPKTCEEIGQELGITRERARQILNKAERKLKSSPELKSLANSNLT